MSTETTSPAAASATPTSISATWVLVVSGDVDILAAPALRQSLEWAGRQPAAQVIVDLSAVTFIDCAGVRPLLEAKSSLGERVHLGDTSARVRWFLELAGLQGVLDHTRAAAPSRRGGGFAAVCAEKPGLDSLSALEIALADMQVAMRERAVIEQAKGVLMAVHRRSHHEAWTALAQAADLHKVHVRDIAAALTATAAGRSDCPPGAAAAAALRSLVPPTAPPHQAPDAVLGLAQPPSQ